MNRERYYLTCAKGMGVPDCWLEDAVQDIVIRVWQAKPGMDWRVVARRAAIDASRKYSASLRNSATRTRTDYVVNSFDELLKENEIFGQYVGVNGRDGKVLRERLTTMSMGVAVDEELEDRELLLDKMIKQLPPRERLLIELTGFHGWHDTDLAPFLNVSVRRVGQLRKQAYNRLRYWLQPPG